MSKFYEAVATYLDDELRKKRETYLVDAETCSDVEYIILEELDGHHNLDVISVKLTNIEEVHEHESEDSYEGTPMKWYKCKWSMISVSETSGKERYTPFWWAVLAKTTEEANDLITHLLTDTMGSWKIDSISESKIVELLTKK